ncbi:hypothetical protein BRD17_06065 [Halobacteriales archaeon SW_7_68_16]|nr:MAG: hypothetical protein BRD17_06065 [Halobacteriales archaeon SW_7_68_16]
MAGHRFGEPSTFGRSRSEWIETRPHIIVAPIENGVTRKRAEDLLSGHGFTPESSAEVGTGVMNHVVRVACTDRTCVVKWPMEGAEGRGIVREWYLLAYVLDDAAVPTPEPIVTEHTDDGFRHAMTHLDHELPRDNWTDEGVLERACRAVGRTLRSVHEVDDVDHAPLAGTADPRASMTDRFDRVRERIEGTTYEGSAGTLKALIGRYHERYDEEACLLHGDPTTGNLLFDRAGELVGLIDWEDARVADPLWDLAQFESGVSYPFGAVGQHDPTTLRRAVEEGYGDGVDSERYRVLLALEHLWRAAGIEIHGPFTQWRRVDTTVDVETLHRKRFEAIVDDLGIERGR